MKNTLKLIAITLLFTTFSCNNDDDINYEITTEDLVVAFDENPTDGDAVGTVQASGNGTLSYSITSQTPTGALSIGAATGALTVADAALFDFETNPTITANISISNSENTETITATINLNNENELSTQNFTATIDENPTDGQVLGTVQATGDGTLSFSITSQSPTGALNINTTTGELTVADPNLFDFETNPVLTADILVDNSGNTETITATINLNDLDEVSAQNLSVTIDENPTNGEVLGTIQATGENLVFAITFQNPSGAFNINASTGEITVADAALFDFETNPNMLATVSVENAVNMVSVNATINLNDVDAIASFLSTSQADYNAANNGDWIAITEAEYDMLANNLNEITRAGTTTAQYNNPTASILTALNGSHTLSNNTTTSSIPANGYIIAFKYKIGNVSNDVTGFKVKQSITANNSGFSDLGNELPSHSGTHQSVFFVLKGNSTPVTANGYLGFYHSSSSTSLFESTSAGGTYWGSSDTSNLNGQLSRKSLYQGLSTTEIQW